MAKKIKNSATAFPKKPPEGLEGSSNARLELHLLNKKSVFWLEDQLCFYAKNSLSSEKSPKSAIISFSEQIPVTRYCPKRQNVQ